MPTAWGRHYTDQELREIAEEMNRRRSGINYEELGEKLRKVANNMEKISEWAKTADEAKKKNPRGLVF